ncbi:hypothetical protein Tco_1109901 [Tanacetum coccineum]|uniref:Retroviral polymerase SH3-like domain-containing protein n=1 Tax=Tanacetum coccineum TaxID=301880 RepID=A0ABQ5IJQ1_9ASTR
MGASAMKHTASNFSKLDKFEGVDFKRWQKKMHFLFSSMRVMYVLTAPIPEDGDNATMEQLRKRAKWDNDDYACRGLILNGMSDPLFDIYQNVESSKELWDSLEAKYMAKDASNFNYTLKHQKEELILVELGSHLRSEESLMVQVNDKPKGNNVVGPSVVYMTEHNNSFKCGKPGHLKKDFKGGKVGNKANGSGTNGLVDGSTNSLKDDDVVWLNIVNDNIASAFMSTSKLNYSILWHARMGHVHFKRMAVVRLSDPKLKTLGEKGIECMFVGYIEHSNAFRFYVIEPNDSVLINSIIESRDAIFDKNRFSSVSRLSLRIPNGTEYIGGSVVPKEVTEEAIQQPEPELRKSKRNRTPKDFGPEF